MRLGDLISKAKIERCGERSLPVLSMTMHDGITRQSDRFKKVVASRNTSSYKVVQPGQLVVGFPIDEGVIYVQDFDEPGIMSPAYNVWNIDSAKVLPGYLNAALHSPQSMSYYRAKLRGTTARRRTITDANLLALRIPLPDINEQHQIVESLNSIQNDIGSCDSQLDIISSLIKSRFVEMFGDPIENPFGWEAKPLGELGELKNGVNFKSVDSGTDIRCLGVGDFKDRYQISNMELISIVSLNGKPNESQMLRDGDIVFVRSNGNKQLVGRCLAVFPGDEEVTFSGFCIRFRNESDRLLLDYLLCCLKSDPMREAMTGRGANIQNLSQKILSGVVTPIPPIALQQEFAAFAARVDKLRVEQLLALKKRGSQYLIAP